MTARDFAFWLQGYFEVAKPLTLDAEALHVIQNHLRLVFVHEIDPTFGGPEQQAKLNAVHTPILPTGIEALAAHNKVAKENGTPLMRC